MYVTLKRYFDTQNINVVDREREIRCKQQFFDNQYCGVSLVLASSTEYHESVNVILKGR